MKPDLVIQSSHGLEHLFTVASQEAALKLVLVPLEGFDD
jgi:hypothetical protein